MQIAPAMITFWVLGWLVGQSAGLLLVGQSAGLLNERVRVQIPAGMAGKFSFPELTLCADSYSVSVVPPCYCKGT